MARRTTTSGNSTAKPAPSTPRRSTAVSAKPRSAPAAATSPDGQTSARRDPTPEEIRQRAYEIYLRRGGRGGNPDADWLQAERELRDGI